MHAREPCYVVTSQKRNVHVNAQLAKFNALFNVALSDNLVDLNPFQRVKAHKQVRKHSEGRRGFAGAQIKKILNALSDESDDFSWAVTRLVRTADGTELKILASG